MVRKITRRFAVFIYFIFAAIFLTACLSPFLNPSNWWFFGFLGLLFPYLCLILLAFLVFFLVVRSKWAWLAALCLTVGWKSISAVFAMHIGKGFDKEKKAPGSVRIMTWNVRSFIGEDDKFKKTGLTLTHMKMFDLIQTYNPDVLTLQEFMTADSGRYFNSIWHLTRHMGYPYFYFSRDIERGQHLSNGTVIFSKFPVAGSGKFPLNRDEADNTESLIFTDLVIGKDTLRIFTAHLQSFGFMQRDYQDISKIRNDPDERLNASKNIFRKMRTAFERRGLQADFIRSQLDKSPYPEIFCGDLNDVPNSYAYFSARGDKKDAFLSKNFGLGQTFFSFSSGFMRNLSTLRIDYIFADPRLDIIQSQRIPVVLSDHIPVIADISTSGN